MSFGTKLLNKMKHLKYFRKLSFHQTGWLLIFISLPFIGIRIKEHKEDAHKASASRPYSRNNRKTSEKEMHKSAITDHMTQQNHTVDWEGAKFVNRESDWRTRGIKEVIWIRKPKKHESKWGLVPTLTYLTFPEVPHRTRPRGGTHQGAAAGGKHQIDTSAHNDYLVAI